MVVKGLKKKQVKGGKKQQLKFVIDCQAPADDNIIEPKDLEKFLNNRIKVNGKTGNLGEKVTVSKDGKHICVAMWSQGKRRNLPWNPTGVITTDNHLMPPSGDVEDQLVNYVLSVLDAFDYKHGPCHTEVMLTPRGPVLIETNCRMHGVQGPVTMEIGTGVNKAAHSLDIFLDGGEEFDKRYTPGPQRWLYPVVKHATMVIL